MSGYNTPRGLRNNNPLNIKRTGKDSWLGMSAVQEDKTFVQFMNMEYGWRAAFVILRNYYFKHGIHTIREIVKRWAPSSENDTDAYVSSVCRHTGLSADYSLLSPDERPGRWISIGYAMACVENGFTGFNIKEMLKGYDAAKIANKKKTDTT
jgi:hypothetical protein